MSSSKNNITYKKTSFLAGNNSEFINEFYDPDLDILVFSCFKILFCEICVYEIFVR